MIHLTGFKNEDAKQSCLPILLKSQGVGLCVQLLNLDHSFVINMHWKVLCFCRSDGSLICSVLMFSFYSGSFSWANLTTCQLYICALTKKARKVYLVYWKGKQSTMVPCKILLDDVPDLDSSHVVWVWRIPGVGHVFYGNRQCLEFCSPLYINLKFWRRFWFLFFWR